MYDLFSARLACCQHFSSICQLITTRILFVGVNHGKAGLAFIDMFIHFLSFSIFVLVLQTVLLAEVQEPFDDFDSRWGGHCGRWAVGFDGSALNAQVGEMYFEGAVLVFSTSFHICFFFSMKLKWSTKNGKLTSLTGMDMEPLGEALGASFCWALGLGLLAKDSSTGPQNCCLLVQKQKHQRWISWVGPVKDTYETCYSNETYLP